uniref:Uncharacterized protein n=1 Tax=uncultured marine group II/III euryarchaeote KM3_87_G01 TaxID=1456533 RepID=A0A075HVM6_9EURY|nr:hypothetical protein [uncultured marine group II/III euryarchaeote KM3_87_G01]
MSYVNSDESEGEESDINIHGHFDGCKVTHPDKVSLVVVNLQISARAVQVDTVCLKQCVGTDLVDQCALIFNGHEQDVFNPHVKITSYCLDVGRNTVVCEQGCDIHVSIISPKIIYSPRRNVNITTRCL